MFDALELAPSQPGTPKFVTDLDTLVRARYPLVQLVSAEEQRLDAILQDLALAHGKALFSWSITRGLRRQGAARTESVLDAARSPVEALAAIARLTEPSLVVLKDFHPYLVDPATVRALRELAQDLRSTFTTVILLSPVLSVPLELEKELSVLEVPLPGFRELSLLLREIVAVVRQGNKARVDLTRDQAEQLIKAAQGLSLGEAENAFAKAIANDGVLDARDIALVLDEKRQVIRKSGLLESVEAPHDLSALGGASALKRWLQERRESFGEPARKFGVPAPRGVLLAGAPGCGKGLAARCLAREWGLPLLRIERDLPRALRQLESVAPAVLLLDLDALENRPGDPRLWRWLQEKTAPVFVAATLERPEALPPALLRRDRFDEVFFLDLPAHAERREVFGVHLRRLERDPEWFDLDSLSVAAEGFSGAEIEQAVLGALRAAFAGGTELSQKDLQRAVELTAPLAASQGAELSRLREWAKAHARPA